MGSLVAVCSSGLGAGKLARIAAAARLAAGSPLADQGEDLELGRSEIQQRAVRLRDPRRCQASDNLHTLAFEIILLPPRYRDR